MNKSDVIVTLALIRQIELQQVATWMLREIIQQLQVLEEQVVLEVTRIDPTQVIRQSARRARTAKLVAQIEDMVQEVMREISNRVESDFSEITGVMERDASNKWLLIFGAAAGLNFVKDDSMPEINGTRVRDYFDRMADDLAFRYGVAVRDAVEGEGTASEITERLKGLSDQGVQEIATTATAVESTVRTGVSAIPSDIETRGEIEGPIGPSGYVHISVLDSRTTSICRSRAWKRWDSDRAPVGHDLPFAQPPLHTNCRSVLKLVFLDDPQPKQINFKEFINGLTQAQREKLFGAERIKLWQDGKITDAQLIRQSGKALTIEKLKERTDAAGQIEFPYL